MTIKRRALFSCSVASFIYSLIHHIYQVVFSVTKPRSLPREGYSLAEDDWQLAMNTTGKKLLQCCQRSAIGNNKVGSRVKRTGGQFTESNRALRAGFVEKGRPERSP